MVRIFSRKFAIINHSCVLIRDYCSHNTFIVTSEVFENVSRSRDFLADETDFHLKDCQFTQTDTEYKPRLIFERDYLV